jgi:F0F1-type ATP synthase alpha subunit
MMIYQNSVAYRQMFSSSKKTSGREAYPVIFFIHSRLLEELLKCQMLFGAGSYSITY